MERQGPFTVAFTFEMRASRVFTIDIGCEKSRPRVAWPWRH